MPDIIVAISKVADGNMLNRKDPFDSDIANNRRVFLRKHGLEMDQTTHLNSEVANRALVKHETNWCRYREVTETDKGAGMSGDTFVADAIITTDRNHALMLPIADCVGAVLYDPILKVLMISHLGRHSLEQEGGIKTVQYLVDNFKINPANLKIWLTPAPSKEVYPIWALDNKGMKEVMFEQLDAAGVERANITDNPADTDKDKDYFSYTEFFNGRRKEDGDYCIVAMMR